MRACFFATSCCPSAFDVFRCRPVPRIRCGTSPQEAFRSKEARRKPRQSFPMDTFSQRPSLSPSSLVFSDRENRRSRCTPAPGPRVARGVYLSNDAFEGIEALWQAEHLVAQARIYAEALRPGAQFQCRAMTMSSALILYGIDTWFRNPPVLYRAHSASGRTWLLPEVPTPFGIVPATESKAVVLTRRRETALQSRGRFICWPV